MSRIDRAIKISVNIPELNEQWKNEPEHIVVLTNGALSIYNYPAEDKHPQGANFYILRDELEELIETDLVNVYAVNKEFNLGIETSKGITGAVLSFIKRYGNSGDTSLAHQSRIRETIYNMFKYQIVETSLTYSGFSAVITDHEFCYNQGKLYMVDGPRVVEFK